MDANSVCEIHLLHNFKLKQKNMSIKVDPKKKRINNSSQVRIGNDYIKKVLKEKKKTGVPVGKWIEGAIDIRIETEKSKNN